MITKLIILYLLIMFFSFRIPSQKSKRGLKRKKLQERTPVVFHLHNLLDTVTGNDVKQAVVHNFLIFLHSALV